MSVDIAVVNTAQKWNRIKLLNRKIEMENEIMENEIKVQTKNRHECWHCSCQHSTKIKKTKLLSRKILIENDATENKLKMKLKLKQNIGISVHIAVVDTT